MSFETEINTALAAVSDACGVCLAARDNALWGATEKNDGTPVTAADYAAQFVLTKAIKKRFPRDEIVAEENPDMFNGGRGEDILAKTLTLLPETGREEFVETLGQGNGNANAQRLWTVDPVDGTAGFIRGAQFAVAVALIENGVPALGFLGCPGLGFILFSSHKNGLRKTRIDGADVQRLDVSRRRGEKIVLCETARGSERAYAASERIKNNLNTPSETIRMDSQCKYALVAVGEADVFVRVPNPQGRRENVWDHAAGVVIVRGAGAEVSDFNGDALDFSGGKTLKHNRGIVAAGRDCYGEVMSAIQKAGL